MFIGCHDGSYFNTDKAICYSVMDYVEGKWAILANYGERNWKLADYSTLERANKECRNIMFWIRSVQSLEPSNPSFQQKFIYSTPKE